jgi:hypothetical protein
MLALTAFAGVALGCVVLLVVFKKWVPAEAAGGVAFASFAVGIVLRRHVDESELKRIATTERPWIDAWARAVGRASGGWDSPRRKD